MKRIDNTIENIISIMKNSISIQSLGLILILGIAAASCTTQGSNEAVELPAVKAEVAAVESLQNKQIIQASGKVEAANSANVSTRMMGNVAQLNVKTGDKVSKGTLLLTISSDDLLAKRAQVEASIEQANSMAENARKDYERFKTLYEKGSATQKELENMTTRYESAKAGLEAAKQMKKEVEAQFAYTNIRAPFSGVVANTFAKVGDIASPGMPLVTIEGTTNYEATVLVPETYISALSIGMEADIYVKASDISKKGIIREVSPSAKNTGGQYMVKIDLPDSDGILPGMFVNAEIAVGEKASTEAKTFVQKEALISRGQLIGVYTLASDNTAMLRWIRVGKANGNLVEVVSGLQEGEKYILSAEGKLYNGARVSL
mgnify:CR=1 FL=1